MTDQPQVPEEAVKAALANGTTLDRIRINEGQARVILAAALPAIEADLRKRWEADRDKERNSHMDALDRAEKAEAALKKWEDEEDAELEALLALVKKKEADLVDARKQWEESVNAIEAAWSDFYHGGDDERTEHVEGAIADARAAARGEGDEP